uniref:Zinc finger protein 512 n=1 Tax=Podarcis muralis TaxID=64176 RepID=A0A670I852_PODMU
MKGAKPTAAKTPAREEEEEEAAAREAGDSLSKAKHKQENKDAGDDKELPKKKQKSGKWQQMGQQPNLKPKSGHRKRDTPVYAAGSLEEHWQLEILSRGCVTCPTCRAVVRKTVEGLKKHMSNCQHEMLTCHHCGKQLRSLAGMKYHIMADHNSLPVGTEEAACDLGERERLRRVLKRMGKLKCPKAGLHRQLYQRPGLPLPHAEVREGGCRAGADGSEVPALRQSLPLQGGPRLPPEDGAWPDLLAGPGHPAGPPEGGGKRRAQQWRPPCSEEVCPGSRPPAGGPAGGPGQGVAQAEGLAGPGSRGPEAEIHPPRTACCQPGGSEQVEGRDQGMPTGPLPKPGNGTAGQSLGDATNSPDWTRAAELLSPCPKHLQRRLWGALPWCSASHGIIWRPLPLPFCITEVQSGESPQVSERRLRAVAARSLWISPPSLGRSWVGRATDRPFLTLAFHHRAVSVSTAASRASSPTWAAAPWYVPASP